VSRILVVDDDRPLLRALHITLSARGYDVHTAQDARTALDLAAHHPPDLAIIDLGLPDLDGITIITALRGWSTAPILVLSARHSEPAKINALDAGADDYITKPFGMGELLARIRAALRRATPASDQPVITTAAFTVDLTAKRVTTATGEARLTPTEWHLLEILVRHAGNSSPTSNCCTRYGDPSSNPKPATCVSTSATSAARSNPTPPAPDTCAPTPASDTGSCLTTRHRRKKP
jgi:two-component system, OmpR family, KDP operon response regulator KdpE